MTDWELGQFVRVWRGATLGEHDAGGYEYGHIETIDNEWVCGVCDGGPGNEGTCSCVDQYHGQDGEVMLIGDDGVEIFCQVKDLEES